MIYDEDKKITLEQFENFIEKGNWNKEFINNEEIWIYQENNLFQIVKSDESKDFSESWTRKYPDKDGSGKYAVYLKYGETIVKEFIFVYMDGGRINVPLPEIKIENEKRIFFWKRNSIDFKIGKLIGSFYIYKNLEGIAKISGIEIYE